MRKAQIYPLLERYGIQVPHYAIADNYKPIFFDHFPAILILDSPKVAGREELAIRKGIHSNEELELARSELIARLQQEGIFLDNEDHFIIVQEVEGEPFFIGGVYDSIFQEVLLFGKGGHLLTIEEDVCYIDLHAPRREILRAFWTTRISRLFPKFHGKHYRIEHVIQVVQSFQELFAKEPIRSFAINPLVYTPQGFVALDGQIEMGQKSPKVHLPKSGLFRNEAVAIIGVGEDPHSLGYALARNALGARVQLYFVAPGYATLLDHPVLPSIDDLPPIDTAIIAHGDRPLREMVAKLSQRGATNIIIASSQWSREEVEEIAQEHEINLVGPGSFGLFNASKGLNLTLAATPITPGPLALLSQSGGVIAALVDKGATHSVGFSHILGLGAMADVNFAHLIEILQKEPKCRGIAIWAEYFRDGKALVQAIRQSQKPICLYKGVQDRKLDQFPWPLNSLVHWGKMALGLCYGAGATIKEDLDSLLFSLPFANRPILILTNARGPGAILAQIVVQHGRRLYQLSPEEIERLDTILPPNWSKGNPIDLLEEARVDHYKGVLDLLASQELLIFAIVAPYAMTEIPAIGKLFLDYPNLVPIFLGGEGFRDLFPLYREAGRLFFNDLENVANIL
ncbi:MAG: CoA-binding protein [Nitratiruptor sp.]|nr:CoA-binding protein [Nitratiruptor sp.]NPA83341.1 CoA-binding protein [Campylobacterota bacterium]